MKFKIGTLFSGIGSPEFGVVRVFGKENIENVFACDIDKFARESYLANHKVQTMYEDVTKVDFTKYENELDLLVGGSPCFEVGTKVITKDEYKNIEDIKVGDYVLTHTGKYQKVLRTGYKKANIVTMKAQGVKPTNVTLNHPYYVSSMTRIKQNKKYIRVLSTPKWINVEDIKKDDFLGIPINTKSLNILNLTEEECYIIGRYIADGHTRKDYRVSEGRDKDRNWQLILSVGSHKLNDFNNINKINYSCYKHSKGVHRVVFSNKRLVEIVEKYCGCGAINKKFHKIFIDLPINLLSIMLKGYMDGDGSYSHRTKQYKATSISEELIITLSQVVNKVYRVNTAYIHTKRPNKCVIEGREVNQHDTYTLQFYTEPKKQSKYIVKDDIIWVRWKETSNIIKETTVYNLEVQNDNSYTANNLIVHNCQSFSLSGKRKGFEDTRGTLFFDYIRAIKEIKPKYFIFENVKGMVNHDKGNTIEVILNSFAELDYTFNAFILNSKDYNIPQNRERFFVVGTLKSNVKHKRIQNIPLKKGTTLDIKLFNLLAKKHNNKEIDLWCSYTIPKKKTLTRCINDILEENVDKKYFYTEEATKKLTKNSDVSVLYSIDRLKFDSDKRVYSKNGISPCLKARGSVPSIFIGAIRGRNVDNPNSREIGLKTKQRLEVNENKICNCLTTVQKDNVLVINDKENILIRRLTPRECLRIQDFDDTFKIVVSNSQIYKQAGNSMSVGVMEAIINSIKEYEEGKISEFHKNLEQNEILDDF